MAINNAVNAKVTGFQSLNATTGVWNGRTLQQGTNITITNADGTGGDPTISATGGGSSTAGATLDMVDDFVFPARLTNEAIYSVYEWQFKKDQSSNFGDVTVADVASGRPGVAQLTTNSAVGLGASNIAIFGGGSGTGPFILGGGVLTLQFYIKLPALSIITARYIVMFGLGDTFLTAGTTDQVNGCYFSYSDSVNSGNWSVKTASASTRTTGSTSTAADTSWHVYKIVVNAAATSVAYYIDGVQVANSPLTTNIPTTAIGPFVSIIETIGTTSNTVDVDLFTLNLPLTTPR